MGCVVALCKNTTWVALILGKLKGLCVRHAVTTHCQFFESVTFVGGLSAPNRAVCYDCNCAQNRKSQITIDLTASALQYENGFKSQVICIWKKRDLNPFTAIEGKFLRFGLCDLKSPAVRTLGLGALRSWTQKIHAWTEESHMNERIPCKWATWRRYSCMHIIPPNKQTVTAPPLVGGICIKFLGIKINSILTCWQHVEDVSELVMCRHCHAKARNVVHKISSTVCILGTL